MVGLFFVCICPYGVILVCVHIYLLHCVMGASAYVFCTLICVWGKRVNICTQCFCLRQTRENGEEITQTVKKLVIKSFEILRFWEGLSVPTHIP